MGQIYNRLLFGVLGLFGVLVLVTAVFVEPLEGDLTRTGGFLEKRFGWQGEQEYFAEPFLFEMAGSLAELDHPVDVVILGDSFTRRAGNSWASYLTEMTGWRIVAFHHRDVSLRELLNSPNYLRYTPALVIYQSVERHAAERLASLQDVHGPDVVPVRSPADLNLAPMSADAYRSPRSRTFPELNERLSTSVHYLKIWGREWISGDRHARVLALAPGHPRLFTSRDADHILLLEDDFRLREVNRMQAVPAIEGLRNGARVAGGLGSTLVTVIFPDKLTAYAGYLEDPQLVSDTIIPTLADAVPMPRLDQAFSHAITAGMVDLYAPNNTHTSSAGSRLAAVVVLQFVHQQGLLDAGAPPEHAALSL